MILTTPVFIEIVHLGDNQQRMRRNYKLEYYLNLTILAKESTQDTGIP